MGAVSLRKVDDAFETTLQILEDTGFERMVEDVERILLKPNLTNSASPEMGITTDVRIVDAVLHKLFEVGKKNVVIGEGSGGGLTSNSFEKNGYLGLAKKYGIALVDMDSDETVTVGVPNPLSSRRLGIARTAYDSDFRVSIAKLKIHSIGVVTGCLKNMMGCLAGKRWKAIVHSKVHERVVDLNKIVTPHFGIIDGIVGNQVDEVVSNPVRMDLLIAGDDVVSVDSVAAECMCVPWKEVPHLVLAEMEGLGIANPERYSVLGESIEDVRKEFDRRKSIWAKVRTGSQTLLGRLLSILQRE
ncbi:MAG: DUF362 domain-containing protein [Thermoplasmata archaeon]